MTERRSSEVPEDENGDVPVPSYGYAERADGPDPAAIFLYVPDATQRNGLSTYRVNKGAGKKKARPIGFIR